MNQVVPATGLEVRSLITDAGNLELSLAEIAIDEPRADEIVVRVQAAPINPSDLGLLLGPADVGSATRVERGGLPLLTAPIAPRFLKALKSRQGMSLPVGNEGAGVVVKAGSTAQHLLGRTVAMMGGGMYTQYRTIQAIDCMLLPEGATARDGASSFINPLTALGMVETMRREGHKALVHTAAASNLGQMLNRICLADKVELVNIVRSAGQANILKDIGARYVIDLTSAGFEEDLVGALTATGATIAFDAIGGGKLAGTILTAMEAAINRSVRDYSRYGSTVHKQVYVYGRLDTGPLELGQGFGMAWGVGGWLLMPFLAKIGPEASARLRGRVADELTTTFASRYTATIALADLLDPEVITACSRRATGEKYLIDPNLAG